MAHSQLVTGFLDVLYGLYQILHGGLGGIRGSSHGWYQVTGSGLALLHHAVSSSRQTRVGCSNCAELPFFAGTVVPVSGCILRIMDLRKPHLSMLFPACISR